MSIKNGKDYLYLVWKEPNSRRQYTVGQLVKNGGYEFSYGFEVVEAIKSGFQPLIVFENIDKTYKSPIMFPAFSSRLPDKKRNGIEKILKKYNLDEYDEYELLKKSGAKLPIDNLEFIDPIIDFNAVQIIRLFYLAGPRHYMGCSGNDCSHAIDIKVGDMLKLLPEPENEYDPNAIKVLSEHNKHIGYVPRYYSKEVNSALNYKYTYSFIVCEVQQNKMCNECIRAELRLSR